MVYGLCSKLMEGSGEVGNGICFGPWMVADWIEQSYKSLGPVAVYPCLFRGAAQITAARVNKCLLFGTSRLRPYRRLGSGGEPPSHSLNMSMVAHTEVGSGR